MSLRRCDRCGGDMDVFDDPPCCGHEPGCAISFCWPCNRVWVRGSCARELVRDLGFVMDRRGERGLARRRRPLPVAT